MVNHAVLSASSSHRWLNCIPSARLELEFENTSSAADEGTGGTRSLRTQVEESTPYAVENRYRNTTPMRWRNVQTLM